MTLSRSVWPTAVLCVMLLSWLSPAHGQAPPTISSVSPQAVVPGKSNDVVVSGGNLAGTGQLWTSFPAQVTLTPEVQDNGSNAGMTTWRIDVPSEVPVGIHAIRVAAPGGISPLRLILVDDLPSVAQAAGNNTQEGAQAVTLPVAVDGTVPSLGQSWFKFSVVAGQMVSFEVVARRLGSPLDPMLRLLDGQGRELAWNDDDPGLRGDSRLQHQFAVAGEYFVEVRDIRYQGGGGHYFRLRMGDFPIVSTAFPGSAPAGSSATVSFAGRDAADVPPVNVTIPADLKTAGVNVAARRANGQSSGMALLNVGTAPVTAEVEPNNEAGQATVVEAGHTLAGRINHPGDVDLFRVKGTKGQKLTWRVVTRRLQSPMASYVRILNADGGQLAVKEDYSVGDASFDFAFPADGEYLVAVEDLHRRGGPDFSYVIEASASQAGFSLEVADSTINVGAKGTSSVVVNVTRSGFNGPIQIAAVNLPEGITSNPTVAGPGAKTVGLTLTSTGDAALNRVIPVHVVGTATVGDQELRVVASNEESLKAAYATLPWGPQTVTDQVAVGVGPKPQIRLRAEVQEVVFGQQLSGSVKIIAERDEGFNEAITLAVIPDPKQGGLPANVNPTVNPIPKDQNEVVVTFAAANNAPLGDFTAVLTGTIKQGNTTVVQTVPGILLRLQQPMTLTLALASDKVAAGSPLKAKVTVARNPAAAGEVVVTFQNLPKGVTVGEVKIPADQSEIEVELAVAADSAKGAINNLAVQGEITIGNAKLTATSGNTALTVE